MKNNSLDNKLLAEIFPKISSPTFAYFGLKKDIAVSEMRRELWKKETPARKFYFPRPINCKYLPCSEKDFQYLNKNNLITTELENFQEVLWRPFEFNKYYIMKRSKDGAWFVMLYFEPK